MILFCMNVEGCHTGPTRNWRSTATGKIGLCEVVVSIIGGRYGSGSQQEPYSISQMELKTAVKHGKALFVFVEQSVYSEYQTYLRNKDVDGIKYSFVDNPAIYKFIEEVESLPKNNPIAPFDSADDIIGYLREQWAGLFQRYLQEQSRAKEVELVTSLEATSGTLNQLVKYLTEERRNKDTAIQGILLTNHPVFQQLRKILGVTYRVFFTTRPEMEAWLKARSFVPIDKSYWDDQKIAEWRKDDASSGGYDLLKISTSLFASDGRLKVLMPEQWREEWVLLEHRDPTPEITDEDIPF
jgi:hypothetical protein